MRWPYALLTCAYHAASLQTGKSKLRLHQSMSLAIRHNWRRYYTNNLLATKQLQLQLDYYVNNSTADQSFHLWPIRLGWLSFCPDSIGVLYIIAVLIPALSKSHSKSSFPEIKTNFTCGLLPIASIILTAVYFLISLIILSKEGSLCLPIIKCIWLDSR